MQISRFQVCSRRLLMGAALAACGLALTVGAALPIRAATTAVNVVDFAYEPTAMTVTAGDTVRWTNAGSAPHTVTADDGTFQSETLRTGASFEQTFATAGTFTYTCQFHPQMRGTVVVTAPAPTAVPAGAPPVAEPTPPRTSPGGGY